ncbi:hypothetical protein IWQ57_006277, partial [Coemansia nantahalensis]
ALASSLNEQERARGELYPRIERIREVSADLAAAFITQAAREGLAQDAEWAARATAGGESLATGGQPDGRFVPGLPAEVSKYMWAPAENFEQLQTSMPHYHHHPVVDHHAAAGKL